ncbi:cation transporter/ATPase, N-terminus, partial [Haematococcus lacustris]
MPKAKDEAAARRRQDIAIVEHELSVEGVCTKHQVDLAAGLSSAQVQALRQIHGYN